MVGTRDKREGTLDLIMKVEAIIETCRCVMAARKQNLTTAGNRGNDKDLPRVCHMNLLLNAKAFARCISSAMLQNGEYVL